MPAADVPVYWIVNLVDRQVEVYTGSFYRPAFSRARSLCRARMSRSCSTGPRSVEWPWRTSCPERARRHLKG